MVLVAVLGYVGVIGPAPENSIFGSAWYFDNIENIAHLVLGVVALAASFAIGADLQKQLVLAVGGIAILVGIWSLLVSTSFLGAGLENPADSLLHLVVGAWAIWAGLKGPSMG